MDHTSAVDDVLARGDEGVLSRDVPGFGGFETILCEYQCFAAVIYEGADQGAAVIEKQHGLALSMI